MKLEARHVRFKAPLPWFTRRRLLFVGKRNTLQLQETALIVEGYLMRLFFPLVGFLFSQAFSEWTTVTVPYSRILRFKHSRLRWARWLVTLALWLPIAFVLSVALFKPANPFWEVLLVIALWGVLALILTLYLNLRILAPRNYLWFRQADGRRVLLVFRIRSRKRQQAFEEQLRGYRQTKGGGVAQPQEGRQETEPVGQPGLFGAWVVLAIYLVAHWLVAPLYPHWQALQPEQAVPAPAPLAPPGFAVGFAARIVPLRSSDLLWLTLWYGMRLLPVLLLSLMLLARWRAVLRWSAVASLLLLAVLPIVHWVVLDVFLWVDVLRSHSPSTVAGNASLVFHTLLAVVLILVTSPGWKEEP